MVDKKTKQFLVNIFVEKWLKENKQMVDKLTEISVKMTEFEFDYGVNFEVKINPVVKTNGRNLGYAPAGFIEELFDAQEFVNKAEKFEKKRFKNIIK